MASPQAESDDKSDLRKPTALEMTNDQAANTLSIEQRLSSAPFRRSTLLREKQRPCGQPESQGAVDRICSARSNGAGDESTSIGSSHSDRKRKRSDEAVSGEGPAHRRRATSATGRGDDAFGEELGVESHSSDTRRSEAVEDTDHCTKTLESVRYWSEEGRWPREFFEPDKGMVRRVAREGLAPTLLTSGSRTLPTTAQDSEQTAARDVKNPEARTRQYDIALASSGIYMNSLNIEGPSPASLGLCKTLLDAEQSMPTGTYFDDEVFEGTCKRALGRNEVRVLREISPLLVPSAGAIYVRGGDTRHEHLLDLDDERWLKCVPLLPGARPQPDYSVGFSHTAFTPAQQRKLRPYNGGLRGKSRFMATSEMAFPFLACEVKCGGEALDIADRQNAHSASVAANAVVELFRAVGRQGELHREILAISISHNGREGRIYGHYALIDGPTTSFTRHLISGVHLDPANGRDRWMANRFTRNVYDIFVPPHLERIQAAVDQLPDLEAP